MFWVWIHVHSGIPHVKILVTQRAHDVEVTSYRRWYGVTSLQKRQSDVITTSCVCWVANPNGLMTSKWRHTDVYATSSRRIDDTATSFRFHVPACWDIDNPFHRLNMNLLYAHRTGLKMGLGQKGHKKRSLAKMGAGFSEWSLLMEKEITEKHISLLV